jgi:hypothetical protein
LLPSEGSAPSRCIGFGRLQAVHFLTAQAQSRGGRKTDKESAEGTCLCPMGFDQSRGSPLVQDGAAAGRAEHP